MKATLFALFVALLMVGCATTKTKDDPEVEADSHPSDTNSTTKKKLAWIRAKEKLESQMATDKLNEELFRKRMDMGVNGTRKTSSTLRGLTLEELLEEFPISTDNLHEGQFFPSSSSYNNSKRHRLKTNGLETTWYESGEKKREINWKDGDPDGPWTEWYENGQKKWESNWKDGKLMSAVHWKPNGEECPVTNVKDGNGVMVWYKEDGTEDFRFIFKDGERVYD